MSDDPVLNAVQKFMDAVEKRIAKQDSTIEGLNVEIRAFHEEVRTRTAQTITVPLGPAGKDGEPGPAGEKGEPGLPGERGADGLNGKDGTPGERGADGINGRDGAPGEKGERGADGLASTVPGPEGPQGERGADSIIPGPPGEKGERGADGIASEAELDAKIEARFADVLTRNLADYHQRTFKKDTLYTRGAVVAWTQSTWLAMADTQAVPGTSPDWQLLSGKGRDGRDAERTPREPYAR